ncbi:hypothetical protein JYU34_012113 [Plutella xylostella]|uniref:Uncharacterized protein n=1 Tax=Plutella xylostella TaxID=51655 RepID=A0ABQ7QEE2_PLUXY|nr:hypothetical protein JYU34_012113 [Plutella xylostella]
MTVKKATRSGGRAAVVARQRLHNTHQQLDIITITRPTPNYNTVVGFNDKDQLQLLTKEETTDDKAKNKEAKTIKTENIPVDDINSCVNVENYPSCDNTLVFYVTKNFVKEAIALKFENKQDFKRIYFTYKYFKMRNRLTNNNAPNYASTDNLFSKKKYSDTISHKNRKNSVEDYLFDKGAKTDFDLMHTTDNDGVTHISIHQKGYNSRFDQPMSLIGIRGEIKDISEIDSIIYTDVEVPAKPERKRLFQKNKAKAPLPPSKDVKVLKGEYVRVNVERSPDVIPKESKTSRVPDILMFRDSKTKRTSPTRSLWSASNKATAGYESDREEWRSSRSQFSTTAFDSLARPTKAAMALTLRKPQRLDPVPQYYRIGDKIPPAPMTYRPSNYIQRPPRLPRPGPDVKRSPLNTDHRKFTSLQNLDPKKLADKKQNDVKKNNYSNLSTRISGLTSKLRDLGNPNNTLGRFKANSHNDVANLKPVLKNVPDSKRPVVRTCSAEPPKKVTFSAFATVQVV